MRTDHHETSETIEYSLATKAKWFTVLFVIALLIFSVLAYIPYRAARQKAEADRVAFQLEQETALQKEIATAKKAEAGFKKAQSKPANRKANTAQILKGSSGAATFVDAEYAGKTPGEWLIYTSAMSLVALSSAAGDWKVVSGNRVTVPSDAIEDDYILLFTTLEPKMDEARMYMAERYDFSVIGDDSSPPRRDTVIMAD